MTHRLATNYAKNYCNRTLIVKVIVENVVTCFLGHGVYIYTVPRVGKQLLIHFRNWNFSELLYYRSIAMHYWTIARWRYHLPTAQHSTDGVHFVFVAFRPPDTTVYVRRVDRLWNDIDNRPISVSGFLT